MPTIHDQTMDARKPGVGVGQTSSLHATVRLSLLTTLVSWSFTSCDVVGNQIQVTSAPSIATTVTKITPIAARPNEVVSLTGRNFSETKDLKVSLDLANGERAILPVTVTDSQNASFAMPDGGGLGLKEVTLTQGASQREVTKFNLIADQADNQLPIVVGDGSTVCSDQRYIDRNGDTKTGTKDCSAGVTPPACSEDGVIGCVTTDEFKSAATAGAASKILSGETLAGVSGNVTMPAAGKVLTSTQYGVGGTGSTGTLTLPSASNVLSGTDAYGDPDAAVTPALADKGTWNLTTSFPGAGYYAGVSNSPTAPTIATGTTITGVSGSAALRPADCSANNVTGCVTTSTYKSADLTNLAAGNIKSTVTIAGVTGNYPSATSPLDGADTTADLSNMLATRESQLRSATNFEFFMSDGTRVVAAGDADIAASNIKDQVNIFGIIGDVTAGASPDAWDLRAGVTVGSVTGKLKVNCRNRVNSSRYNYDGAIGSIGTSAVTSGSAIEIWDTIDDYNNNVSGLPPSIVTAWGSDTDCGGVESAAGDDNVWKDVTTTSEGAASNCATDGDRCTMQDKITGLWWSKLQTNAQWNTAWSNCQSLNHNGQTGWRLPTQKELMEAYTHGIRSAARTTWITEANMNNWFWSGSSGSSYSSYAWAVVLATGLTSNDDFDANFKGGYAYQVVCVR